MSDHRGIRETLTRYVRTADDRDSAGWSGLFAVDATFSPRGGEQYAGRPAIRTWFEELFRRKGSTNQSLHLCSNMAITVTGQSAEAVSDVVVYERSVDQPWRVYQVNRYYDHLVHVDGQWLIASRVIEGW